MNNIRHTLALLPLSHNALLKTVAAVAILGVNSQDSYNFFEHLFVDFFVVEGDKVVFINTNFEYLFSE